MAGLQAGEPAALSSRRRIDLVVAGSAYSASIDANAVFLYRILAIAAQQFGPGFCKTRDDGLRAEHELWIRCVLALFYRLGACRGRGYG